MATSIMTNAILTTINIDPLLILEAFATRFIDFINNHAPYINANTIIKPVIDIGKGKKDIKIYIVLRYFFVTDWCLFFSAVYSVSHERA